MAVSVGTAYVDVLPEMDRFGRRLGQETAAAGTTAGKETGRRFGGAFLGPLRSLGGALVGILAGQAVIGQFKAIVTEASDLGESINAVQVSFGDAADEVLKLGKNAATSVGLSRNEFNALAVQFGAFASTIAGPGGDVAATLDDLTTRAADFASVMNLEVSEAAELFQSGLAGETEPLRRFGIDLSAASVEAFAYANGIAKSGEELTENQKVQARYGSLLKQTAKTQGDFANTSDSLANQQRILGAEWKNLQAQLGQALVPLAAEAVGAFRTFLPSLLNVGNAIADVVGPAFESITGLLKPLFEQFEGGGSTLSGFGKTFGQLGSAVQGFVAAVLPTLQQIGRQVLAVLVPALSRIWNIIQSQLVPAFASFLTAVRPVATFFLTIFGSTVVGVLQGALTFIQGVLQTISGLFNVFAGILTGDWSQAWKGIQQIATGIWAAIRGAFRVFLNVGLVKVFGLGAKLLTKAVGGLWKGIRGLFGKGFGAVRKLVSGAWAAIRRTFSRAIAAVRSIVARVVNFILSPFRRAFRAARNVVRNALGTIRRVVGNGIGRVVGFFRRLPGRVVRAIGNIGRRLWRVGRDIIRGMIDGVRNMAGNLINSVRGVVDNAIDAARNLLGIASPSRVFREFGTNIGAGLIGGMDAMGRPVAAGAERMSAAAVAPMQQAAEDLQGLTIGAGSTRHDVVASTRQLATASRSQATAGGGLTIVLDAAGLDRSLAEWLRRLIRVEGGGDVQVALGQGRAGRR